MSMDAFYSKVKRTASNDGVGMRAMADQHGSLTVNGTDYQSVAASQSASQLGVTGAQGDYLSHVTIVPASTSPGAVSITDGNGSAITIFAGGASSLTSLASFTVVLGAKSTAATTPGWKVTTGASVSVMCFGAFT